MKKQFDAKGLACPMPVIETKKLLEQFSAVETTVDNFVATQNLEKLAKQSGYDFSVKKVSDVEYVVTIAKEAESVEVIDTFSKGGCIIPVTLAKRELEKKSKIALLVNSNKHVEDLEKFSEKNNYSVTTVENDGVFTVTIERDAKKVEEKIAVKDDSYIVVVNKKIMGHGSEELGKKLIKGYFYALTEQEVLPEKILFYNDGATLVDEERSHVLNELRELEANGVEIVCCGACIDYHNIKLAVGNPTNMYFMVEDMRKANKIIRP